MLGICENYKSIEQKKDLNAILKCNAIKASLEIQNSDQLVLKFK